MPKILDIYQVDAFTDGGAFTGNPAAVMPLSEWLPDDVLLNIAKENNLSETAFVKPRREGDYDLRWFTPAVEVDLCGHATLAAGHVVLNHLHPGQKKVMFFSASGPLPVTVSADNLTIDFPALDRQKIELPSTIKDAIGGNPTEAYLSDRDYLIIFDTANDVMALKPDFKALKDVGLNGFIASAPGRRGDEDVLSRCFFPAYNIDEDPVTGSAHSVIVPYWADRLDKTALTCVQGKARLGRLGCKMSGDRVLMEGQSVLVMSGQFFL